jgi:8-oxo-dGTP diphosphatase / 2-hydroxy-dATP diphosphatase
MGIAENVLKKRDSIFMKKIFTLSLIYQHPRILLGFKKRGFGEGRWNGFGGKPQEGESIEDATRREVREEVGLELKDIEKVGFIEFEFEDGSSDVEVHFFKTEDFEGEPLETEEMRPEWFHVDAIPLHQMWPDDAYWFPLFLQGKKFKGRFRLDRPSGSEHTSVVLDHVLEEVDEL